VGRPIATNVSCAIGRHLERCLGPCGRPPVSPSCSVADRKSWHRRRPFGRPSASEQRRSDTTSDHIEVRIHPSRPAGEPITAAGGAPPTHRIIERRASAGQEEGRARGSRAIRSSPSDDVYEAIGALLRRTGTHPAGPRGWSGGRCLRVASARGRGRYRLLGDYALRPRLRPLPSVGAAQSGSARPWVERGSQRPLECQGHSDAPFAPSTSQVDAGCGWTLTPAPGPGRRGHFGTIRRRVPFGARPRMPEARL
jgi:hypothetical protein